LESALSRFIAASAGVEHRLLNWHQKYCRFLLG